MAFWGLWMSILHDDIETLARDLCFFIMCMDLVLNNPSMYVMLSKVHCQALGMHTPPHTPVSCIYPSFGGEETEAQRLNNLLKVTCQWQG